MCKVYYVCCIIFFIFSSHISISQDVNIIRGKVTNSKTGAPVQFATIRLNSPNGLLGVVSNADGFFQIPGKYRDLVDTLKISCIGYQTKILLMNRLQPSEINRVELDESAMDRRNYDFKYKNRKLEISWIEVPNRRRNQVIEYILRGIPDKINPRRLTKIIKIRIRNLRDPEGRELNKVNHITVNQFRELFVQAETDHPRPLTDSLFVIKNEPLYKNPIRQVSDFDISDYWMNTPLIKN